MIRVISNTYRGYTASIRYNEDDSVYIGSVEEISESFRGRTDIFRLRDEQKEIMSRLSEKKTLQERITAMNEFLDRQQRGVTEYSEDLVRRLVEKVIVFDEKMVVEFKSGITVKVDG